MSIVDKVVVNKAGSLQTLFFFSFFSFDPGSLVLELIVFESLYYFKWVPLGSVKCCPSARLICLGLSGAMRAVIFSRYREPKDSL